MSERGSFVTEYLGCNKCLEALKGVLLGRGKYLCSTVLPSYQEGSEKDTHLPVIAGKIGGLFSGEEFVELDAVLREDIEKSICHSVRIAVLCDDKKYDAILTMTPRGAE